ncbi:MAG TPA: CehA/McbA family metallohydrolase, partial [Planctomycetota bacterium]|nr:CehA/McbA family metallohydrolase [Planctomycetota bacterium]
NHIHANYGYGAWYNTPATMRLQVEGEGLRVANFVVANSDTDGIFDREFFRGRPDPLSGAEHILYWNEEFRATLWGHMTLVNLKQLVEPIMTGFKETTNPWDSPTNSDIADRTHLQGGHVNYTHPAQNVADPYLSAYSAKSLPVDVALGKIDSLDINGSFEATVPLWHRLLNCGFRLPASAGTDCFLNRIRSRLPGSDRAYVKIDGPFSYDAWVKGLKAGRTFVTNGPMLEFTAGGEGPGGTVRLAAPGEVEVKAIATAPVAVDRVEILVNGVVVAKGDGAVKVDRSGWIGARAYAGRLQVHSSPVYVEVAGKSAGSKADAEYFLAWIDRLEAQLKKRDRVPGAELEVRVLNQLHSARTVYRNIIELSK